MSRNFWLTCCFLLFIGTMIYMIFSGCNSQAPTDTKIIAEFDQEAQFVGEQKCQSCHQQEHNDWKQSDHFLAMQPAVDSTVLGDFNNVTYSADGVSNRFFKKGSKFYVNTQGDEGKNSDYEILYTFGYFPLQQYLIAFPGGRMQSLRASWNSRDKKWFHQYTGQNIHHKDWLHWTGASQNWNTMCASCHSTNLQKNYILEKDSFHTTWTDMNTSCESCHGPGSNHIDFMKTPKYQNGERLQNSGFVYSRDTTSQLQLNTCAPCHARKTDVSSKFIHSDEILDDLIPEIISNEFYFPDGQIKEEDYEYGSFSQSKMFHNNVKCSSCHNPHSGKLKKEGNLLCLSCHKPEYDNPSHHFHAVNTESSKCINCHMPQKTFMGNDHRRDHSFRIPRPDQSVKYGTPNTCTSCHKNQSAKWAADAVVKWYGPERRYHFSDDLAPGSLLNDKSEVHLLKLLADTTQPEIARATAANYLGNVVTQKSADALIAALHDKKSLVRYHAIRSLENFPVEIWKVAAGGLLSDMVRAVRIAAADLYHNIPQSEIPASVKNAYAAANSENKLFLLNQTDFAVGNVMLADYELQSGNYQEAIRFYLRGLKKDSLMNYARLNLSAAYNTTGKNVEALNTLQQAALIDPANDRIFYNLGLLQYELNNIPSAIENFQKAMRLGSVNPALYYNYGLLLQQQGKGKEAEKALLKGYQLNNQAENINYALAYLYLQMNRPENARKHAMILRQLNPQNPEYQAIFKNLGL